MIDKERFYQGYRKYFGSLNLTQKEGLDFLLQKLDESNVWNLASQYAYILGTIYHECGGTWQPIKEAFWLTDKDNYRIKVLYRFYKRFNPKAIPTIFPYGLNPPTYEGRGYCQLTHNYNYLKFEVPVEMKTGKNIYSNPNLVLDKEISYYILERALSERELSFTGKILTDYISEEKTDYYNARKTVNGLYKADLVKGYAEKFYQIIEFK